MDNFTESIEKYIIWKNDTGIMPGCSLRFKRDNNGELYVQDDESFLTICKRQKLNKDDLFNKISQFSKEISICTKCLKSEYKLNLQNQRYCEDCAQIKLNTSRSKIYKQILKSANIDSEDDEKCIVNSSDSEFKNQFDWDSYLEENNLEAVPESLFLPEQMFQVKENPFKIGMKLEGIDPIYPSRFCVLTITDIKGQRLRLHFNGYSRKYDFWVNSDSNFIFPVGFCEKTGRKLEPISKNVPFSWDSYLLKNKAVAAPEHFFNISNQTKSKESGFKINYKLEATDVANDIICVATIKDVLNKHVLITFDGWDEIYDYWAPINSSLIYPINWCKSNGKKLTPPREYKREFIWKRYLEETRSKAVPSDAFTKNPMSPCIDWKIGMRLEVVDKRNPYLIRAAAIKFMKGYYIQIVYDGWPEEVYSWYDGHSPDLHPINWCKRTGYSLEPPKSYMDQHCLLHQCVEGCNGKGHVQWYKYDRHLSHAYCPYYSFYLANTIDLTDRLKNTEYYSCSEDENDSDYLHTIISPFNLRLLKENYQELKSSISQYDCKKIIQKLEIYAKKHEIKAVEIIKFDSAKIYHLINEITDDNTADIFKEENIDGLAFLSLSHLEIIEKFKEHGVTVVAFIYLMLNFLFQNLL